MADISHSSKKTTILLLVLILIVSIVVFNFLYVETRSAVKDATREELRSLAAVVATQIDGDTLSALGKGDESSPGFVAIRDQLYEMERSNPDIKFIYTMRSVNNTIQFIVDAEYGMNTSENPAHIGDVYPAPSPEMVHGFLENTVENEFTTDQWGTTLSGYAPIRDSQGNTIGIVGVDMSADRISDRMNFIGDLLYFIIICAMIGIVVGAIGFELYRTRAEESIRNSERTMRAIFNNAYDGIFLHEVDGTIIDVNDQVLTLYDISRDAAKQLSITRDFSASSNPLDNVPQIWQDVIHGHPHFFEWRAKRPKDNSEFDVEVYLRKINLEGKDIIIANVHDISARKKAQEAMRLVSSKLSLMNTVTRHDITNQLLLIRGYLALIKEDPENQANGEYFLRVERAAQTIQSLITFARDYQNIGVNAPRWQHLRETIQTVKSQFPVNSPPIKIGVDDVFVYADLLLEKVFYNLIDNAIRHGGPSLNEITFSSTKTEEGLVLTCEDNGTGVSGDEKELIFTRDYGRNTGLGLFLSREILSITGMTIKETGEYGKGARFEIYIPNSVLR